MGIRLGTIPQSLAAAASKLIPFSDGSLTRLIRFDTLADWILKTYTGFVASGTAPVARTVQGKLQEIVSITDYGAASTASAATNTTAATNAMADMANGGAVFVPPLTGTDSYDCNHFTIPSGTVLYGAGKQSHLRMVEAAASHFMNAVGNQNILIEKVRINGNASRTGAGSSGAALQLGNNEVTYEPRVNNVTVRDCWIDDNAFSALGIFNAHVLYIDGNYITGSKDSGIPVNVGSSRVRITNNYIEGFTYCISLSSNGNTDYATTGNIRQCHVSGNICKNTKTSGYGIELDGFDTSYVGGNVVRMEGGAYGIKLLTSGNVSGVDVFGCDISDNVVEFVSDVTSSGLEISGTGDITSTRIAGNVMYATSAKTNSNGLYVFGGVKCNIDGVTVDNLNKAMEVDHNNVASEVWITRAVVRGSSIGLQAPFTHSNKCKLVITDCDIQGSSSADYSIGSGFNLYQNNSIISNWAFVTPNTLYGDVMRDNSVSGSQGDASKTVSVGVSERTLVWDTPITTDRSCTFNTTRATTGNKYRVVRTANATGAFNLNIVIPGPTTIKALGIGAWGDVEYQTGLGWKLTATGSL